MKTPATHDVHFTDLHPQLSDFRQEALEGLSAEQKRISPKYFYDQRGSELFELITELDAYYPTRTEIGILRAVRQQIADLAGPDCALIEYGSGSSTKTPIILDALPGDPVYVAIDISRDHLRAACERLSEDRPDVEVYAVCADYTRPVPLPAGLGFRRRVGFFPGSTIGNFSPEGAGEFLRNAAGTLGQGGAMILGVDLKKDSDILHRAYDDDEGVTAEFNLNLLARMNRELDADFDLSTFAHRAHYDAGRGRVEMHLESLAPQVVEVGGEEIPFEAGETIHTENSYKYSLEEIDGLARRSGFRPVQRWVDDDEAFSVHWLET